PRRRRLSARRPRAAHRPPHADAVAGAGAGGAGQRADLRARAGGARVGAKRPAGGGGGRRLVGARSAAAWVARPAERRAAAQDPTGGARDPFLIGKALATPGRRARAPAPPPPSRRAPRSRRSRGIR